MIIWGVLQTIFKLCNNHFRQTFFFTIQTSVKRQIYHFSISCYRFSVMLIWSEVFIAVVDSIQFFLDTKQFS